MLWFVLGVGVAVGLGLVVVSLGVLKLQKKRAREVLAKLEGWKILAASPNANCFGQESHGLAQVRGNGVLVLTPEQLYFEMWVPKKEYSIPLHAILRVETPKSHLAKTKGAPLLKVVFRGEQGREDSIAWLVKDLASWQGILEKVLAR